MGQSLSIFGDDTWNYIIMAKINEQKIVLAAKNIEKMIDFKKLIGGVTGQIAEAVDGLFFQYAFLALNNAFSEKMTKEQVDAVEVFLDAFNTGEWDQVDEFIIDYVNEVIDIPYLDETAEGELISGLLNTFVNVARMAARKA